MQYSRELLQHLADQDAARKTESRHRYHAEASKQPLPRHAPAFGRDPAVVIERARRGMCNPFLKATLNLTDQGILMRDAPDLAKRLKAEAEGGS